MFSLDIDMKKEEQCVFQSFGFVLKNLRTAQIEAKKCPEVRFLGGHKEGRTLSSALVH